MPCRRLRPRRQDWEICVSGKHGLLNNIKHGRYSTWY